MKKKDNRNTVDVRIGDVLKTWVVNTYGTDVITLSKKSNFWMIIKQNLECRPKDYAPVTDRTEYISFVLLRDGKNTKIYTEPDKLHPERTSIRPNMLFRCCITEKGEAIIRRLITEQFYNAFHCYMKGALNNNSEMAIVDAITEFLMDSCHQEFDNRTIARLTKHWYRYRLKNNDDLTIPIFF